MVLYLVKCSQEKIWRPGLFSSRRHLLVLLEDANRFEERLAIKTEYISQTSDLELLGFYL